MKTIKHFRYLLSGVMISTLAFLQVGCEQIIEEDLSPDTNTSSDTLAEGSALITALDDFPHQDLSDEEIKGLLFMREEEKLARDTYIIFYEMYGQMNFNNISKSEQAHMDAILYLLNKYELEDPAYGSEIGEFRNRDLQKLFDDLQKTGRTDKIAALKVGALIEETDILDIQQELDHSVDNQDVRFVYENLIRGSKNHLNSFVAVLGFLGIQYEPVLLDQVSYQAIIND